MNMRPLGATFVLLLALASPALAQGRSLSFDRFDAVVDVRTDGSIEVLERIQVTFEGSWNGIFRRIPVRYETPQGFGFQLFLDVESVTDGAGGELEYWLSEEQGYRKVKIAVPGAYDATRDVAIRYSVSNGLRFFDEHDELYWNVTGDEWEGGIASASARIVLPEGVSGIRTNAWTGVSGSTNQNAEIQESGREIRVETSTPLRYREGLTVAVAWNPGVVSRPGALVKTLRFLRSNVVLGFPILFGWLFFSLWRRKGRDPAKGTITTLYEPPDELRPAELGTLIDSTPHMRDITATLVDLAVRGYLELEEVKREGFLKFGNTMNITRKRPPESWSELHPHERALLAGLFESSRAEVTTDELKQEFYVHLSSIKDGIWARLLGNGYYDQRPDRVVGKHIGMALFAVATTAVLGQFLASRLFLPVGSVVLAAVATAALTIPFAILMPARTRAGVRVLERALGFEEFLRRADGDRLRRMNVTPDTFERFLPYAMALGVEERWGKAFEGIYTTPPNWYHSSSGRPFRPGNWVSHLSGLTDSTSQAMASTPSRSSGGSGFGGGGGSSGGGSGGGGGGGW